MKIKENYFKQYLNMLREKAWRCVIKWGCEYSEAEAQAFYIFCKALEKYDEQRSSFSTHLFIQLKSIDDYFEKQHKLGNTEGYDYDFASSDMTDRFFNVLYFYEEASSDLSEDAQQILCHILEWNGIRRKPSFNSTLRYFKCFFEWNYKRVKEAWEEIKIWWNDPQREYSTL